MIRRDPRIVALDGMSLDFPSESALKIWRLLELAAEDLVQDNEHWANCLHCQ